MRSVSQLTEQRRALLSWFDQHRRDLPWRRTSDPYAIWVSEIMLQQTRVAAVLDHYARWTLRFPTIAALAAAEEPAVLAQWSGLGYYRRARFLHAGARTVVSEHGGELPPTASALRLLPGIGEYTSAAIASIAFGEPVAVIDGNVERVILRLDGLSASPAPSSSLARRLRERATEFLAPERPGDWNQSMMELGATLCLPRAPLCLHCPLQPWCVTRGEHPSAPRKPLQNRTVAYGLAERTLDGERQVLLVQRPASATLMPGLWELPELPPLAATVSPLLTLRHAITVTNYTVHIVAISTQQAATLLSTSSARWVLAGHLPETALTGLARKALKRLALWPKTAEAVLSLV